MQFPAPTPEDLDSVDCDGAQESVLSQEAQVKPRKLHPLNDQRRP